MSVKHVDLDDCYTPRTNNEDLIVDVTIGDGQAGSYAIFLGTRVVGANAPGNVGKKADVVGKNIIISTTIVDELRETNWTSMTVTVREGINQTQFGPYRVQAETHNDTVIYSLKLIIQ